MTGRGAFATPRPRSRAARLRELALGIGGTVGLGAVLFTAFGTDGLGGAAAVGLVWLVLGGPYGYTVGQVLVATVLPVPLDAPAFLPVQAALLVVCFGRLLASVRPLAAIASAVASVVVAGALVVVSLGSVASLWGASAVLVAATALVVAFFRWYEPVTGVVTVEGSP
jgi:hypothetical protein